MGFNSVYQILKELFPQVDARLLKAVAIEHSKDPSEAVESILTEVLPFISEKSKVPIPIVKNNGKMVETTYSSSSILGSIAGEGVSACSLLKDGQHQNINVDSLASSFYDANDIDDQQSGNTKNEEFISFRKCEKTCIGASEAEILSVTSGSLDDECCKNDHNKAFVDHEVETLVPSCEYQDTRDDLHVNKTVGAFSCSSNAEDCEVDVSLSNDQSVHQDCNNDVLSYVLNTALHFDCHKEQQTVDCNSLECRLSTDQASVPVDDHMPEALGRNLQPEAERAIPLSDADKQEMNSCVDAESIEGLPIADADGAESDTVLSTIITRSGQICRINLLEDIIEDAKKYKETMFSAMESVLRLLEEVEHQEKEAEQAKEAAARGGLDILEKVEQIKKMLKHAKEANDMHAGEVYGEKSILATEVRELQTRLLGLADERDKSLSSLDEIRKTLEARLIVAEEERNAAEKELFEKQETARGALAEQELIMEKVVQESKLLQQEAEENAKLRDFLMEKGRLIDVLQGEISIICQDIKSLKEDFDEHVSVSKSLSVEQTSFRLASSHSSVKSMASDPATEQMELPESPRKMSGSSSVECQTPISSAREEANGSGATARKELLDDDWELFDF